MITRLRPRLRALASCSLLAGLVWAASTTQAAAAPGKADAAPAASKAAPRRFALVVGSNHTLDPSQSALRFADDDAARVTELLVETGVDTELVTRLDRDSQAMFPALVSRAHRPDGAGLDAAYAALVTRMQAAKDDGAAVELLVYYSGHGDVGPDGQGYLTLDGDKLTRARLFGEMLSRSPADHNHIIIDACRSEQFVLARGSHKDWKPDRADVDLGRSVQEYLDKNHLGGFPNTGVVLAHSADQQTHEWDRYRGGIFTHELLSGLRGGADLNGDGRIEYSELGAFVSAANHGVDDPRARLEVVVRPPTDDERLPVLVHGELRGKRVLLFGPGDRYHYTVEDARGVRLADLRRSGEQPGYLRLPDGDVFVGRSTDAEDREEVQVPASAHGVLLASLLSYAPAPSAARGALDQAFRRGLFSTPFGPGYYHGYTARLGLLGVAEPEWQGPSSSNATTPTELADPGPAGPPDGEHRETHVITVDGKTVTVEADEDEDHDGPHPLQDRLKRSKPWGGVFLGIPVTPFNPTAPLSAGSKRITANDMQACLGPREGQACQHIRGFDLRWQLFRVGKDSRFPRTLAYFRSGYEAGRATFEREGGLRTGDARQLTYVAVPLWFGGNMYLFDEFPLRPYAGLGFGLDVIRLDYDRVGTRTTDTVARPGFELHAGLELRITNYVALTGEVKQQWSARKRIPGVPDLANEGVTFITGVAIGFGLPGGGRH